MSGIDDLDRKYGLLSGAVGASTLSSLDQKYGIGETDEEKRQREEVERKAHEAAALKEMARAARAAQEKSLAAGGALPTSQIEQAVGSKLPTTPAPSTADEIRSIADPALFAGTHAIPMAAAMAKGMGADALVGLAETAVKASQGPPGLPYVPSPTNPAPVTHALREKLDQVTGDYLAQDPGLIRSGLLGEGEAVGMSLPVGEVSTAGRGAVKVGASLGERLAAKLPRAATEAGLFGLGASAETQDPVERAKEIGAMTALGTGLGSLGAVGEHSGAQAEDAAKKLADDVRVQAQAKDTTARLAEEKLAGEATTTPNPPEAPVPHVPTDSLPPTEPAPEIAPSLADRRANVVLRDEVDKMLPLVAGKSRDQLIEMSKTAQPGSPLDIAIERAAAGVENKMTADNVAAAMDAANTGVKVVGRATMRDEVVGTPIAAPPSPPVVHVPPVEETAPAVVRTPAATAMLADAPPLVTGIKNATTSVERASRGLPEIEVAARGGFGQAWMDSAKQKVDAGEIDPRLLAQQVRARPRPLSDEEDAALLYDRMRLYNEHRSIDTQLEQATAAGDQAAVDDLRTQRAVVQDAIDHNDHAVRKAGTENGRGLAARKMMVAQDYTLPAVLQRARVAKGSALAPEQEAIFTKLTTDLADANRQLDAHKERIAQLEIDRTAKQMAATEQRRQSFAARTGRRSANRAQLDQEFGTLSDQFRSLASTPRMGLDPELVGVLGKMAVNRVQVGVTDAAQIVDHVYQAVKDHVEGLTVRDVRDAISGYGITNQPSKAELAVQLREAKRQMRLFSALEDAESSKRPLKSGFQHDAESPRVLELRRQVTETMRRNGVRDDQPLDPEAQMKSTLDAVKTRLRREIDALDKQLKTGQKPPTRTPVKYDAEAVQLRSQRDTLKEALDAATNDQIMPQQRIDNAQKALQRSIDDLQSRIAVKDTGPKQRQTVAAWSPAISELRQQHAKLSETMAALRDAARPPKDPEVARRQAYKTSLQNRLQDLETRLSTGDFTPKPKRPPMALDTDTLRLKTNYERLKKQIDFEREKLEMGNRTPMERSADLLTRIYRAQLLSSVKTFGKIGMAAGMRTVTTPAENAVWSLWRHLPVLSKIDEMAPREGGGLSLQAEAKAFASLTNPETYKQAWEKAKTGMSQPDILTGKTEHPVLDAPWLDMFGHVHAAVKEIPRQNEIVRSAEKRYINAARSGADMKDPTVLSEIYAGAVNDGNRSIFMSDNWLTSRYQQILSDIQRQDKWWAVPAHTALKLTMPIVKVPTNFVGEVGSYAAGFPKAAATLIMRRGLEKMSPEDADYIARNISKQTIGLGLMAVGYANADSIGGYYSRGDKRDAQDVKPGGARVLGVDVPRFLLHTPALEMLQVGATLRRVKDAHDQQGLAASRAAAQGVMNVGRGMAEEVPFYGEPIRASQAAESPSAAQGYVGSIARSLVVPPDVQNIAKMTDKDAHGDPVKRYPNNLLQEIQAGVPGLREQLPAHREPPRHFDMDVWGNAGDPSPITSKLNAEADRIDRPVEFVRRNPYDVVSGKKIDLPTKVYQQYIQTAGRRSQQALYELISQPDWKQLPIEQQQDMWEHELRVARHMSLLDVLEANRGRH